ncbi:biopolymer transporter ExbD [Luteolibacter flavescens]|uniref:Biopolymer transporter ExbD n=1 Tax=Luteolibacter flavescens TaxID=1859460 RepID=A0ABT3FVM4_9BACT|nr:biopolymer transporter ExbD [Luteolibacter flavescens]MCW1887286.1 biopolymer transporter ExbD [Luteolibacter flavescens]
MASADDKSYDDINVTPMVDLYLVLLLIFIIMTTAGVQGMKVQLPKSSAAVDLSQRKMQAITVNNEGKIALNTIPVTLAELESKLGTLKSTTKDLPVVVRGDRKSQYQGIMDVLEVLGRVGIDDIGLAAETSR